MKIKFLSAGGSGGEDTNTNLGTDDLTQADATRIFKVKSGGVLKISDSGGNTIATFTDSSNILSIGKTTPYDMPTERGSANQIIRATNGTGGMGFASLSEVEGRVLLTFSGQLSAELPAQGYAHFLRDGSAMTQIEDGNLTNDQSILMPFVKWDGGVIFTEYQIDILTGTEGLARGFNVGIFYDTLQGQSAISGQYMSSFGTNLAPDDTTWASFNGTIPDASFVDDLTSGDIFSAYIKNNEEETIIESAYFFLTIYGSKTITQT